MRSAVSILFVCLLVLRSGSASPGLFENLAKALQLPSSSEQSTVEATTAAAIDSSSPAPSTEAPASPPAFPTLPPPPSNIIIPGKPPAFHPAKPHAVVLVFPMEPSKFLSALSQASHTAFNPISAVASMIKPVATAPLADLGQVYNIPLQAWDTFKNVVGDAVEVPKELMNDGEKAINDLLSSISRV